MLQKGCIVIIENDDLIRELIGRWLGEAGYKVTSGGPDRHARKEKPRLVIANIASLQKSGEVISELMATYGAPILLISARFRPGLGASASAASQLGVRKVLAKPFTRKELLDAVNESMESA